MRLPPKLFTPIGRLILVKVKPKLESPGGIIMPDSSSELATLGHCPIALVVAVGPECKQIKRGQWIASFPGVGATKIWFEGYSVEDAEHMVMLQEIAIAGIIDDPEKHGLPVYTEDANPQGRRESKSPIRENQERDRGTKT